MTQPDWSNWDKALWPIECLESEFLFRKRHARLFPLIRPQRGYPGSPSGAVMTSQGPGILVQVFENRADVVLVDLQTYEASKRPRRSLTFLHPSEVWPSVDAVAEAA